MSAGVLMIRLQAQNLTPLTHGFFGRTGGFSNGIFASLNCGPGSGDDRAHIMANRHRALSELTHAPHACLLTLYQIHSAVVVIVDKSWETGQGPKADAMATNVPGLALGIMTADCAPVLLADAQAGVIGAAHAGWKGALSGVTDSVLQAMERLGANRARVVAAIGPCISQANYEVGEEFLANFEQADSTNACWFAPSDKPQHYRFDLPGYLESRLTSAGLGSVESVGGCTYAEEDRYFSYRRATHRGEKDYGRQVSAILLR